MDIAIPAKFCVTASVFLICLVAYMIRRKEQKLKKRQSEKRMLEWIAMRDIIPEIQDPRDRQALLLHEIQSAEELMLEDRLESAVTHFANAIAICSDPHRLVTALRETMPSEAFDLLLKVLANSYGKRIGRVAEGKGDVLRDGALLSDDDSKV